jgi:heptaprenyl diphosphate synthase
MTLVIMVPLRVILQRLEVLLPLPSPWIKLGLANLMTLVALVFLGFKEAVIVTFLRVVIGSILGPDFILSLVGGIAAIFIMGVLYQAATNHIILIGISIFGAYTHTPTTSLCVYYFLIRDSFFFTLLPFFFSLTLLTGILTSSIANMLSSQMQNITFNFKKLY